jgi:hypothetical protein
MLWGAWHFCVNFWASGVPSGAISLAIFLPAWLFGILVGQLTAYRVLMVWVYDRTGSLLVAILMHESRQYALHPHRRRLAGTVYLTWSFALARVLAGRGGRRGSHHGQLARPPQVRLV